MNFYRVPFALLLMFAVSGCISTAMGDRTAIDETSASTEVADSEIPESDPEEGDASSTSEPDERPAGHDGDLEAQVTTEATDDSDSVLMPALQRFIDNHGADSQDTRYAVEYVDLNEDGLVEALVLLSGEYWCGTGGCNMAIFEWGSQGYVLTSNMSLINAPVWVSSQQSSGWKDLIVEVSGGGIESKYVSLRFNGSRYPVNPSLEPAIESTGSLRSQALFGSPEFKNIPVIQSNAFLDPEPLNHDLTL